MAKKSVKEIAAEQAAKEAARVLATAAKLAAKSALDVPFSASLEHRLTLIEAGQSIAATTLVGQHDSLMIAIGEVKGAVGKLEDRVKEQNGRVSRLELRSVQERTIYGAIVVLSPFVFYTLMRFFGGG